MLTFRFAARMRQATLTSSICIHVSLRGCAQKNSPGTVSGGRAAVQAAFGTNWTTFTSKFGDKWQWEIALSRQTNILTLLKEECNFTTLDAVTYARAIVDHLKILNEVGNALSAFSDDGQWPTLFDPDVIFPKTSATPPSLSFITTTAGNWVFFSDAGRDRMIRPAEYKRVWNRLELLRKAPGRKGLLIKGHPGIGKTCLLDVLLAVSLHKYPQVPIIVIAVDTIHVFVNVDGKTPKRYKVLRERLDTMDFPKGLMYLGVAKGAEILVLHDIKHTENLAYQGGLLEGLFKEFSATCVVASSPDPDNFKDFYKATRLRNGLGTYTMVVLPTLELSEAREFVKRYNPTVSDAEFASWYDAVGGVPRHLGSEDAVQDAVGEQRAVAAKVEFSPDSSASDEETNKIVQMLPSEDRLSVAGFDFVSHGACRAWLDLDSRDRGNASKLSKLLRWSKEGTATRDALGRAFENWFGAQLKDNPTLCLVRFDNSSTTPQPLEPWVIPKNLSIHRFPGDTFEKIQATTNPTLHIPMSCNCPVVDFVLTEAKPSVDSSAVVDAHLFQVTLSKEHRPKVGPTEALLTKLKAAKLNPLRFVWVVDSVSSLKTKQPLADGTLPAYDDIPQYLCRIDEFMCWVQGQGPTSNPKVAFPCPPLATEAEILHEIKTRVDPKATKLIKYKSGIGSEAHPLIYA